MVATVFFSFFRFFSWSFWYGVWRSSAIAGQGVCQVGENRRLWWGWVGGVVGYRGPVKKCAKVLRKSLGGLFFWHSSMIPAS